jgi:probable F420-dependent oxidoreductase
VLSTATLSSAGRSGPEVPKARDFRFGTNAGVSSPQPEGRSAAIMLKERARQAEAEGYAWIAVPDHVFFSAAPIAAMTAMAAATTTLRVSAIVLDNNVRHPVMLAKEAAMIDVLSEGRLELGIGAGSLPWEHPAFLGIAEETVGVRVRRLDEALRVIKGLWGPSPFSIQGEFYRCEPLDGLPKPLQQPHPPIRVGGFGKRLLSLAGREADIVNILARSWPNFRPGTDNGQGHMSVATRRGLEDRIEWIRAASGGRFNEIELELMMWGCSVTRQPEETARSFLPQLGRTVEEILAAPDVAIGTVSFICERLHELREVYGISSFLGVPAPVVALLAGT